MTELIRLLPDVDLIRSIDALLPQTQCGKCGHPGCKPYAEGIAGGEAINKCPPGGDETIVQLAELLSVPVLTLDMQRGTAPAQVAFIREAECIGCTKCIQACPVDAILGASRLMHTVIIDECTGCDLCVAPCPVDCIEMHPLPLATVTPIFGGLAPTPSCKRRGSASVVMPECVSRHEMHACTGSSKSGWQSALRGRSALNPLGTCCLDPPWHSPGTTSLPDRMRP